MGFGGKRCKWLLVGSLRQWQCGNLGENIVILFIWKAFFFSSAKSGLVFQNCLIEANFPY